MKRKHILMSALILSALTFTSCDRLSSTLHLKQDMNSETAYSTPGAAESGSHWAAMMVGSAHISDEGVGMYLTAEFASDQAFAGLAGLSDARNNNVLDQFDTGLAPSYNDMFNTDWVNYYKAIFPL